MPDIRCSRCGNNNPDFLDVCQFCQSPLKSDSMLHAGDAPRKIDTGELEPILPDWLKDARQQSRESAKEEEQPAIKAVPTKSQVQRNEAPDLLAGLMSQADNDDDDVPGWLAGMNPTGEKTSSKPPLAEAEPSDFFAQFSQKEEEPSTSPLTFDAQPDDAQAEEPLSWMGGEQTEAPQGQDNELSGWFSSVSSDGTESAPAFAPDSTDDNTVVFGDLGGFDTFQPEQSESKAEDLSWLHDLEKSSKETGDLSSPQVDAGFDFAPAQSDSSQEDLSWLNNLGATPAPAFESPVAQSESSQEDMSWLNNLGGAPAPAFEEPVAQSESSQEDLGWLSNLGATPAPAFESPAAQPESSQEDMSWLNNLGGAPAPAFEEPVVQSESSQEDMSWLNNLGGVSAPVFEESSTQPESSQENMGWLNNLGGATQDASVSPFAAGAEPDISSQESTPDWLTSAMEEPSMPAPGAVSMDWFNAQEDAPASEQPFTGFDASFSGTPDSSSSTFDFSSSSSADVDSLFNIDMPDMLSEADSGVQSGVTVQDDNLAPVELPSWVQAMRPVESALDETADVGTEDQFTEQEGPLAGFQGVIPFAPIGSSLRPKAISLKLQVTDEQQVGATLFEQIIAGETTSRSLQSEPHIVPQRALRWTLSGVLIVVLSLMLWLNLRMMPIFASATVNEFSNIAATIPDGSPVLVVVDYEPSLAGELEVAAGPILDQLALSRHSVFTFISMSPNGFALVDRLILNTNLGKPAPSGLGYQAGAQYFNMGFLPGGSAGVFGFIENTRVAMPLVNVDDFSKFEVVIVLTDNAESGRVWVEQVEMGKANHPELADKPLIVVASSQAGPMLQPYTSSSQVDVMVSGLSDAVQYEFVNNTRPGVARAYWDAFGAGLFVAVVATVLGSLWNLLVGLRERRAKAEQE